MPEEITTVKEQFLTYLISLGVCAQSGMKVCTADEVTLECGETPGEENSSRRRRDTLAMEQLKFGFKIHVDPNKIEDEIDCQAVCDIEDDLGSYCDRACSRNFQTAISNQIVEEVVTVFTATASTEVDLGENSIVGDSGEILPEKLRFGNLSLKPTGEVTLTSIETACAAGQMKVDDKCGKTHFILKQELLTVM